MNKKKDSLLIIIVTHNNSEEITRCIQSIAQQSILKLVNVTCMVIDNYSKDNTFDILRKLKKNKNINLVLVKNKVNIGFSKAVNQAVISSSGFKWLLFLNPDIEFFDKTSIFKLLKELKKYKAEIAGGLLYKTLRFNKDNIHYTFYRIPDFFTAIFEFTNIKKLFPYNFFHKQFYYLDIKNYPPERTMYVDGVSGAFMLIKATTFRSVGLFDTKFFLYLEDVDLCNRAKKSGNRIIFCPMVKAIHFGGASSKKRRGRILYNSWIASRRYYFQKHLNCFEFFFLDILFKIDELFVSLLKKIRKFTII